MAPRVIGTEIDEVELLSDDEINSLLSLDDDEAILAALCDDNWSFGKTTPKNQKNQPKEFDFDEMNHQNYGSRSFQEDDFSDFY